jgi:sigma-B regulation protein RsbU (phosphoserine phosphatase)
MPLPILVRGGQCRPIHAEGVPLGLLEHTLYQEISVKLDSGDLLALFSDGIVEAMNLKHEEFGMRRLENVLRHHAERSPEEITEAIFKEVRKHEQGRTPRDDQTLLLVRIR